MPFLLFLLTIVGLRRSLDRSSADPDDKQSGSEFVSEVVQEGDKEEPILPEDPSEEIDAVSEGGGAFLTGLTQGDPKENFNISMEFSESLLPETKSIFIAVGEYISHIIKKDIPDFGSVDDLNIRVEKTAIDGPNGISGQGGVLAVRAIEDTGTPYEAVVRIDGADEERLLANGNMDEIVAHEVLHALGFGTLWEERDLIERSDPAMPRFTGQNAVSAYQEAYPDLAASDALSFQGVPLNPDERHWAEQFYGDLLLPSVGEKSKMSSLSVASLEDLGFETIFDPEDADAIIPNFDDIDPPLPMQRSKIPNSDETKNEDESPSEEGDALVI